MGEGVFTLLSKIGDRLARQQAGNVAIVFALALPLVIGGAGLGAETTYWRYEQLQMQGAADAAAYDGAVVKRGGGAIEAVRVSADAAARQNGLAPGVGVVTVNSPTSSGAANAVEVIIEAPASRFFTALFSTEAVTLRARSVASFNTSSSACVLALHTSASKAALVSGSGALTLQGCSVMANSVANDALTVQGSASLNAPCAYAVGGASVTSGAVLACGAPVTQAPRAGDPYKDLPQPPSTSPCRNDNGATLQPGTYCNGMTLTGSTNLNPGVYVVEGGDLRINANADVAGSGVTIFLKGGARVSMNGNATVNLSAPTSGTYSGILFFGDRTSLGGQSNTFNGTAASRMTGAIYFASQAVNYQGNFSGQNGCVQVVGLTVQWTGNTTVGIDCTAYGMTSIPGYAAVRLAE